MSVIAPVMFVVLLDCCRWVHAFFIHQEIIAFYILCFLTLLFVTVVILGDEGNFVCINSTVNRLSKNLCPIHNFRNITVCVQVSVWYVSRGSEGGGPSSPSTPPSPLSLPLLVSGHEPHLRCHYNRRTTTTLHDSLPACCASSTAADTGQTDADRKFESDFLCNLCVINPVLTAATVGSEIVVLCAPLHRHQYHTPGIVWRQRLYQEAGRCSPPPPLSRFLSSPTSQTSVSFRPSLLLNSLPVCPRSTNTARRDRWVVNLDRCVYISTSLMICNY